MAQHGAQHGGAHEPAALRNRVPILEVLRAVLPRQGLVLEIASGSGIHSAYFAEAFGPDLVFQPTEREPAALAVIDATVQAAGVDNVRPALQLDAAFLDWPVQAADAIVCINMIHISPWASTLGLMRGAGRVLPAGGVLYLYGPFLRSGQPTTQSNAAFDADLKRRDPSWGLRYLDTVAQIADENGLGGLETIDMPSNNLSVVFRKRP